MSMPAESWHMFTDWPYCCLSQVSLLFSCCASICRMHWRLFRRELYTGMPLQWQWYLCQGEWWLSFSVCCRLEWNQLSRWYTVFNSLLASLLFTYAQH